MILKNEVGLIGDFMGTIPVMIELSQAAPLIVYISREVEQLFNMIPKRYDIWRIPNLDDMPNYREMDLGRAFDLASHPVDRWYMTQAFFAAMDMPVPETPPRPELDVPFVIQPIYDFIFAPHSRALPPDQRLSEETWRAMARAFPEKRICVFGNPIHDTPFIFEPHVTNAYGQPFIEVLNIMKRARVSITVSTGISHIAFALNTPNLLVINQGKFAKNPEAILIEDHIPEISVERMVQAMHQFL